MSASALPTWISSETVPAADLAVRVHHGPERTLAQTYAALGAYVAEHQLATDGPVRETYLQDPSVADDHAVTEIGWPVSERRSGT